MMLFSISCLQIPITLGKLVSALSMPSSGSGNKDGSKKELPMRSYMSSPYMNEKGGLASQEFLLSQLFFTFIKNKGLHLPPNSSLLRVPCGNLLSLFWGIVPEDHGCEREKIW